MKISPDIRQVRQLLLLEEPWDWTLSTVQIQLKEVEFEKQGEYLGKEVEVSL